MKRNSNSFFLAKKSLEKRRALLYDKNELERLKKITNKKTPIKDRYKIKTNLSYLLYRDFSIVENLKKKKLELAFNKSFSKIKKKIINQQKIRNLSTNSINFQKGCNSVEKISDLPNLFSTSISQSNNSMTINANSSSTGTLSIEHGNNKREKNRKHMTISNFKYNSFSVPKTRSYSFIVSNNIILDNIVLHLTLSRKQSNETFNIIYCLYKENPKIFGNKRISDIHIYNRDMNSLFRYGEKIPPSYRPYYIMLL